VADVGKGRLIHLSYEPDESLSTGCTISEMENGQFSTIAVITPHATNFWTDKAADFTASFDPNRAKLRIITSEWNLVVRALSIRGAGLKKRLDLVVTPSAGRDPSKDTVAPHGLLGQAWDGDGIAVDGKTDGGLFAKAITRMSLLGKVEKVKTVANAEGAIEGVESDYIVAPAGGDPYATKFKFSRFGLSYAPPRNVSQLTGVKKLATSHSAGVNGFMAGVEA
jgi:hypothetical protein